MMGMIAIEKDSVFYKLSQHDWPSALPGQNAGGGWRVAAGGWRLAAGAQLDLSCIAAYASEDGIKILLWGDAQHLPGIRCRFVWELFLPVFIIVRPLRLIIEKIGEISADRLQTWAAEAALLKKMEKT